MDKMTKQFAYARSCEMYAGGEASKAKAQADMDLVAQATMELHQAMAEVNRKHAAVVEKAMAGVSGDYTDEAIIDTVLGQHGVMSDSGKPYLPYADVEPGTYAIPVDLAVLALDWFEIGTTDLDGYDHITVVVEPGGVGREADRLVTMTSPKRIVWSGYRFRKDNPKHKAGIQSARAALGLIANHTRVVKVSDATETKVSNTKETPAQVQAEIWARLQS